METITLVPASSGRQMRLLVLVFAALFALLALGYYYFIRADYAVLYSGLRPADASAIVAELDTKSVSYELRYQGSTILVVAHDARIIPFADRVLHLEDGILYEGSEKPVELYGDNPVQTPF